MNKEYHRAYNRNRYHKRRAACQPVKHMARFRAIATVTVAGAAQPRPLTCANGNAATVPKQCQNCHDFGLSAGAGEGNRTLVFSLGSIKIASSYLLIVPLKR
jgi:hypothetical protein